MKFVFISLALLGLLSGCYQMRSDDSLRSIPVTNNPNLVPGAGKASVPSGVAY
jgi:hypothetical protein